MKKRFWNKKRFLLQQREQLCADHPMDFIFKIKEIDEALAEEEKRHQLAAQRFKASRRGWSKSAKNSKKA